MARTVRNPLENRTPVRTISSVMRNAPRQNFRPTQLDFGDVPDYGYGRPDRGVGGQQRTPVNRAVTSVVRPTTGTTKPVAPVVAKPKPIAKPQTIAKPKTTSVVKPAVKPATPVKPAAVTKPAVKPTTTVKPAVAPVKPVTQPVAKTPVAPVKPITSTTPKTPTSPVKPVTSTIGTTPKTTTTIPTKTSTGSNLTSTLLKTAAGAGAGTLLSKLLTGGTKTTTGGGTTGGTTVGTTGRTTTTGGGATSRPIGIPIGGGTTKAATKTTPAAGAAAKTAQKTATKAAEIKAENPGMTDEEVQAELDRIKAEEQALGVPEDAVLGEDGNYTVTDADGNISTYDKDGNLIGYEGPEATALTQGEGEDTVVAGEGEDTTGGLTRSLTDGTDTTETVAGEDTTGMTDLGEGYFQDGSGNIYSASGDLLYAVDESGAYHDPSGDLIYDPNADTAVADETVDSTDTSVSDNTWTDPETGETWAMSDDGSWSLEGDTTDYTDNTDNTDYTVDDTIVADDEYVDDGSDYEVKKGGAIHRKTKGGLQRFADGDSVYSDTSEEVQPWQNVDYNYGELDDPTLTGYTLTGEINPVGNIYARTASLPEITSGDSMNGNAVDFTDNGDGTASYWDGNEYVTVDSDTGAELYRTDENGQIVDAGDQATGPVTSSGSGNRESYATAAAQQAARGNQQNQSGVIDALMGYVQNNPGLAGGAIGALLASMLDQAQSGETAMPSQPVDISALTSFGPRTTDFGPGMTGGRTGTGSPIVSYADYAEGYGAEEPDDRLYSDLGISGWLREPDMSDYRDEEGNLTDRFGNPVDELGYLLDDGTESASIDSEPMFDPAYDAPVDESGYGPVDPSEFMEQTIDETGYPRPEDQGKTWDFAGGGSTTHYTFGRVIDPAKNLGIAQGMKKGGLSQAHTVHSHHTNPVIDNRVDFRKGSAVNGAGDGQSDDIPAWLADGEYVMDAELVSMLGNGSNKAGAKVLDKFREEVRAHKRSAPLGKIPPKAKSPLNYLKEAMNG